MTILEVTAVPFSSEYPGGGERYPAVLARELARTEDVVLSFAGGATNLPAGVTQLVLPGRHLDAAPFLTRANPLPLVGTLSTIRNYLASHRSEIEFVHVHNLRTAFGSTWILLSKLQKSGNGFKLLLTDHAARFAPFPRVAASMVDYYVAVSNHSLLQLNGWAEHPGIVLPPPVPQTFLEGPPVKRYEERDIDLLYLGRVVPWKRPDKVLELAGWIERRLGRPTRVTIAGSPLDEAYWQEVRANAEQLGSRGGVDFVRSPTDTQVRELYDRARWFVLLSMKTGRDGRRYSTPELAPATVVEAAARGTPAIVSDLPGVNEQVVPGVTGLVVDPQDLGAAAGRIGEILDDPAEWTHRSAAAREFALRERSPRVFGEKMAGFLRTIRAGGA